MYRYNEKVLLFHLFHTYRFPMPRAAAVNLDSCRASAISNNKELLISQEKINAAHYQRKAAFTNYLPNISASGGYMRSQKELSILSDAQKKCACRCRNAGQRTVKTGREVICRNWHREPAE